jgi:hypothetical protein
VLYELGEAVEIQFELRAALLEDAGVHVLDGVGVVSGVERNPVSVSSVHSANAHVVHVVRGSCARLQAARDVIVDQCLFGNVRLDARVKPKRDERLH